MSSGFRLLLLNQPQKRQSPGHPSELQLAGKARFVRITKKICKYKDMYVIMIKSTEKHGLSYAEQIIKPEKPEHSSLQKSACVTPLNPNSNNRKIRRCVMSITAKELAKKLDLSAAAVSMALNNKPGVSEETRKTVFSAAVKYGYDFSRTSESKRATGDSVCFILYKRQGAVVGDTPFFAEVSEGIEAGCKQSGVKLQISYIYKGEDVARQLEDIVYSGCSGIVLLATEMLPDDVEMFTRLPIPLVFLDAYYNTLPFNCVMINNVQGAFLATDHLITKVKKQPGYLHSAYSIANFEERANGFYNAVRHHGLSTSKSIVHRLTPSVEGAHADMLALLDAGEETASCYFADNDWIAIGAMKAFQARGYRIPDDISIIGFDDVPLAGFIDPPLTTVHVPKRYMGETAAKRVVEIMHERGHSPVKTEIQTRLIIRGSS